MTISRRSFLKNISLSALAVPILQLGNNDNLHVFKNEVSIFQTNLPSALQNLKIGFISDPHISICNGEDLLTEAVDLLLKEPIDLAIFGGDYVLVMDNWACNLSYRSKFGNACGNAAEDYYEMQDRAKICFEKAAFQLSRLKSKCPCFSVLGNHDRWNSEQLCSNIFSEYKIPLLVNEEALLKFGDAQLNIFGADDYWTGIPAFPHRTKKIQSEFNLLVSHNPDYVIELRDNRLDVGFDLALCGHTHGGQVKLPVVGAPVCNIQDRSLLKGLYSTTSFNCFTSSGVGTSGFPWRYNCPPEVVILTLLNKESLPLES